MSSSPSLSPSPAPHANTFLGKAGSVGLEVLDTLGSSMTNLFSYGGFVSNSALRGAKVSILAFEVANTIVKGYNLMQSLSDENIQILEKEILLLEEVQILVSTDMKELIRIAAADKREEFEIFLREVLRFGNIWVEPQWHNLDRALWRSVAYNFRYTDLTDKLLREEAENAMQELANLAQFTSELYLEYHALDRLEQLYWLKLEEAKSLHLPRKGESPMMLQRELKHQRKVVRNLQKKSIWSKNLEEVVEKLVNVAAFIQQAIAKAFDDNESDQETNKKPERLGVSGLALHYANLITQIDNIASHHTSLHPNMRNTLYNGLPASVKACLRSCLQALDSEEVMTEPQIKAEMDKTLHWLLPVATNTVKAHQSFGWVGEWANTGFEFGKNTAAGSNNINRLQTLDHADKHKMDRYILELIVLLHRLIGLGIKIPKYTPIQPPTSKGPTGHNSFGRSVRTRKGGTLRHNLIRISKQVQSVQV